MNGNGRDEQLARENTARLMLGRLTLDAPPVRRWTRANVALFWWAWAAGFACGVTAMVGALYLAWRG